MMRIELADIPLYYMVHFDNLQSIREHGIMSRNRAIEMDLVVSDIADPDVISRRAMKVVFGKPLTDYVPLYFNPKNPMLSRRRAVQDEIVILCIGGEIISETDVIFTDGNAANSATRYFQRTEDIGKLNWECLRAERWSDHPDGHRQRMAEVLIPGAVSFDRVRRMFASTRSLKDRVLANMVPISIDVAVEPRWYF